MSISLLLMEGKSTSLGKFIEEGGHYGMQSFNQALSKLYLANLITFEEAILASSNPDELRLAIQGIASGVRASGVREGGE